MTANASRDNPPFSLPTSTPNAVDAQSAAFRGASHAFLQTPITNKHLPKTYSGTNGALAAASSAGLGRQKEKERADGAALETPYTGRFPLQRRQKSVASDAKSSTSQSSPLREHSPSHVAARLAVTLKTTPTRETLPVSGSRSGSRQPSPLQSVEDLRGFHSKSDTSTKDTNSLVQLFESKQKPRPAGPLVESVRYVIKPTPQVTIFRPSGPRLGSSSSANISLRSLSTAPVRGRGTITNAVSGSHVNTATDAAFPVKPTTKAIQSEGPSTVPLRHLPQPPTPRRTTRNPSLDGPQDDEGYAITKSASSHKNHHTPFTDSTETFLNEAATDLNSRSGRSPTRPGLPTRHTEPGPAHSLSASSRPPLAPYQTSSKESLEPVRPGRKLARMSDSYVPQLTVDSLANAMVASSLASSRAPSPSKPPPLPPPRRHGKHSLFHHNRSQEESRTPSPAKGLRQTMREPRNSEDEEDSRKHRNHRVRKHPNKHHEGDRKRYRNQVTERERKRYEGVWAANRGVLMPSDSPNSVINIVVRELWKRSRLPDDVLEEVWDLVDNQGIGRLERDEFVVGMFLIDQRLKGNKLPFKVSDSIWSSVRRLNGVNVPIKKR